MKTRNLFITLGLSLAVGLGVGVGLSNNSGINLTNAISAGDTIYFQANATWQSTISSDVAFWLHCWSTDSDASDVKFSNVSGNLYSATLPSACSNLIFARGTSTENKYWNQSANLTLSNLLKGGDNTVFLHDDSGDGGYSFDKYSTGEYLPSQTAGKAYLRGSWGDGEGWKDLTKEMTLTGENEYTIENVLLSSGSQIKGIIINNNHFVDWYDASDLQGNSGATFVSPNITINETGNYTVKFNSSTNVYTVNVFEDTDLTAAVNFANAFEESMAKYCPIVGSDANKGNEKLASEWAEFQKAFNGTSEEAYNITTVQARQYLKTLSDGSTLDDFRIRYDAILRDYSTVLSSYDFLERVASGSNISYPVYEEGTNAGAVIVVAISLVSITSVAGYFYFKKKSNNA